MKNYFRLFVALAIIFLQVLEAVTADVVYYFPLNSTTDITGTLKNSSCSQLSSGVTAQGSTARTVAGPNQAHSGLALYLGSNSWVNLGDFRDTCISNPTLCPSGMTVSFWVYLNATTSGNRPIIVTGRLDTSRGIQVFLDGSHTNIILCDGTRRYPVDIGFPQGWAHVIAVYNRNGGTTQDKFFVYVNGTTKHTARYSTTCTYSDQDTHLILGHDSTSGSVSGREVAITQLAFHLKSFTLAEVQALANNASFSGIQLNCPPPPSATTAEPTSDASLSTATGSGSGGSGGQSGGQDGTDGKKRTPVVLILLSISLFILVLIVIALLIGCCFLLPKAKAKGYKCL